MEEKKIKEFLKCLNYIPKDGTNNVYIKNYSAHNNYKIEVDFNNKKINYGDKIAIGNAITSNFSKPKNFVVLECVNRILEKGYKPENIELEKIYPSGHGHSGNLDILVYSEEHTAYLMIECKTDGCEYNKEHNKMLKDGGQLFTYYALDRDAKYLCLYSSIFNNGEIKYKNSIISVSSEWRLLSSSKEIYLHWNKSFKDNGIFEEYAFPFDILISNPPYSVEAFKTTLKDGENTFELYNSLTDNSSEIECLFVERMKQLLKVGGWAGVILPTSIFSNGGIYSRTREIIFKYFKVKAIVELGSGTFMKTGTNTIILFLERRADNEYKEIENSIDKFFNDKLDVTVSGIENIFSKFVSNVYDDLTFDDYIKIIEGNKVEHELYNDYKKEYSGNIEYIKQIEKEKLLYFILTYNQEIVVIKTGKKQEEKKFLGYEFSERRGHEGLKWLPSGTKLYNESNLSDKTKANYYIYNAFKGVKIEIDESLSKNISYNKMSSLFEYGTSKFDKRVNLNKKTVIQFEIGGKYNIEKLGNIATVAKGTSITKAKTQEGNIKVVAGGVDFAYYHNISNRPKNTITVSASGANAGYVNYWNEEIFASDCTTINSDNPTTQLYIYYCLKSIQTKLFALAKGQAQPHVYPDDLSNIRIPMPPIGIQQKIVDEIEKIEKECNIEFKNIEDCENEKNNIIDRCFSNSYDLETLENITDIYNGGTPDTSNQKYWNGEINWATLVDTKNKYLNNTQRTITKEGLNNCNATILPINSILFSSRATIGDVSIAKVPVATNQGYKNFVCKENKLYYEYLYYILKHEAKNIEKLASGMTYPEISKTMISKVKIPLPAIDEQKLIVNKIEQYEECILESKNKIEKMKNNKENILKKYL